MTAVLDRQKSHEARSEWNHSCTPQCSNPCTVNQSDNTIIVGRTVLPSTMKH